MWRSRSTMVPAAVVVVMVVVVLAVGGRGAAGEKLDDGLELITREELAGEQSGFFPQARDQLGVNAGGGGGVSSGPPPPLPLSYLPPAQGQLPIESSLLRRQPSSPPGFNDPQQSLSAQNQPNTALSPSTAQFAQPPAQFNPSSVGQDTGDSPVVPGVIPLPILEEGEEETPTFLSKVGESKLAIIGGVMGATTAVWDGLKDARESLVSGLRGAVTAKTEAFDTLREEFSPSESTQTGVTGGGVPGGSAVVPGGGAVVPGGGAVVPGGGAVVPYPIYPPYPQPSNPRPSNPQPVYQPKPATFQPKPGYFQPKPTYLQSKPAYPVYVYPARPGYQYAPKPSPLAALKSKVEGLFAAKKEMLTGALAKVTRSKAEVEAKFKGLFSKPTPAALPWQPPKTPFHPFRPYLTVPLPPAPPKEHPATYHPLPKPYPVKPYPAKVPVPVKSYLPPAPASTLPPTTTPAATQDPLPPSAPPPPPHTPAPDPCPQPHAPHAYYPRPLYAIVPAPPPLPPATGFKGWKEKLEAKKKAVFGAVAGAFARLKGPFQYVQPAYVYPRGPGPL